MTNIIYIHGLFKLEFSLVRSISCIPLLVLIQQKSVPNALTSECTQVFFNGQPKRNGLNQSPFKEVPGSMANKLVLTLSD